MISNFDEYLKNGTSAYRTIALTSKSYKNKNHYLEDKDINCELATYGDALLKLALSEILFEDNVKNITEEKKKYESDEALVKNIAKNFQLLMYIRYDEKDDNIPKNYEYKDEKHKYIATAVEALLAAFYLDNYKKINLVMDTVKEWKRIIDTANICESN